MVSLKRMERRMAAVMALSLVLALALGGAFVPMARAQEKQQAPASAGEKTTPEANSPAAQKDESEEYRQSPTVKKMGAMVGMSPAMSSTVFTLTNLAILLGAVGYALVKALPKFFRGRSTVIQKSLLDARTATEEANTRLSSVEQRLSKLDEQIAAMRTQAESDSVRDEQRIKASVEDEKARIVAAAEAEIHSATAIARREIQTYAAELAIEQAARKLVISAETDRLLVESFAQKLGGGTSGNGGQN